VSGGALGVRDRAVAVGVEALVAIAMTAAAILGGGHALGRGGGGGGGIGVLGATERGEETEGDEREGRELGDHDVLLTTVSRASVVHGAGQPRAA
jgi:hypothetical protein